MSTWKKGGVGWQACWVGREVLRLSWNHQLLNNGSWIQVREPVKVKYASVKKMNQNNCDCGYIIKETFLFTLLSTILFSNYPVNKNKPFPKGMVPKYWLRAKIVIKLSFCWNTWNFFLFLGHISAPNLFYISKITLFLVYFFLLVLTIFLPGSLYRSLHLFFVY